VSLQQEMSLQNATLSNLLTTDALIKTVEEVARLRLELQRNQEDQETLRHACDQLLQLVLIAYETNEALIRMIAPLQQERNSHISGPGDEASSVAGTTAGTTTACPICGALKDDAIENQFV
jgi:E3 ubiquitin-protein ligase BOI-like protein